MDHIKVLKRAFEVTWRYRALWVFGIVLALAVASAPASNPSSNLQYTFDNGDTQTGGEQVERFEIPEEQAGTVVAVAVAAVAICGCCCLLGVALSVAKTAARYVAETSLIRMVDEYEETGEKRTVKEGLRMGWSRNAFRLFLIDVVIWLIRSAIFAPPIILWFLLVGLMVVVTVFGGIFGVVIGVLMGIALIGVLVLLIVMATIFDLVIMLLTPFFYRTCILEKTGVTDAIGRGVNFVKRHLLWDVAIMALIVIGLHLGWAFVTSIIALVVFFAALVLALVLSAIPLLLIGLVGYLIFSGTVPWIVGGVIAGLVFLLALITMTSVPLLFLEGLKLTFLSTLWTLTYRELRALEGLEEKPAEPSPETADTDENA